MGYEFCAVLSRLMFKGLVGDIGLFVGFVGNGAQNDEGDSVEVGCVCDGNTFHLCAEAVEGIHEAVLLLRCADELVAADNPALKDSDSGDRFSDGPDGGGTQRRALRHMTSWRKWT